MAWIVGRGDVSRSFCDKYLPNQDKDLDPGIRERVLFLTGSGVETFESCEGGDGHAFPEPTVRFHGSQSEGYRVAALLLQHGYQVREIRRVWQVLDGELTGPQWEVTFPSADNG